ncbi:MAG: EAL domain-containing protein [Rubrivivax sp.]|nr:EAL domain-containing protein [Rubrivivax sp.]
MALEQLVVPSGDWGAIGLALGVLFALTVRWGVWSAVGGTLAMAAVQDLLGVPAAVVMLASTAGGLIGGYAALQLRRRDFDRRLERPRDVLELVVVLGLIVPWLVTLVQALPLAFSGESLAALRTEVPVRAVALAASAMVMALPLLSASRDAFAGSTARPGIGVDLLLLVALFLCTLLPVTRGGSLASPGTMLQTLMLYAPPALLLALLMRAGLVLSSVALAALAVTLAAVATHTGMAATGSSAVYLQQLAGPVLSMLVLLLIAQSGRAAAAWRENRWEWALDGSRMGVADWNLAGPEHFISATWVRLSGHEGGPWSPRHWLSRVHTDDRGALQEAIGAVASGAEGRRQLELRMPAGDVWRWFEATLMVLERSASGQPMRLLATVVDVDDRHEAQQRQRLSASLFLHLHEGLLITDEYLRALDVNPAYTQILGVQREEVLGTVPALLRPNPPDPLARQQRVAMWTALHEQGSWRGELLERRRNGELCTLAATITAVPGQGNDARYHVLVISDITEQQVQRERLERQAHFDELTRLPNRTRLSELMADAMRAADRDGYLLTVCYLDLDHFKPVNDRHGHAAGDRLLAELAGRLRSALRTRETWADVAARLGGDEFVLLLRAGTLDEARLAVERVLRVVAQPYQIEVGTEPVQVTASMGASVYPIDRSDADTLLRHADHAMYGAKQSGRNGYLFFDPEHRRRTEERVMAIGRVQEALDQSEFVLYYQPKVDMKSGRVLGLEALLRWDHPQQGLIAPLQFLPLIENTGLSARVGDWALAQGLEHLAAWRRAGFDISVSVNISARHIQEPDFALRLSELLARYPESLAEHLELEMLETAAHADIESTSALMARCRTFGVRFALDDFGTGYSTLTYLKRLPVDTLKIDRSFVHHMLDDSQDRAIVEGVIGLARTFGCTVVAEGVESPAQARTLLDLGCAIGQGIGIAAPMPASQVAGWIRDYRGMFSLAPAAAAAPASASPGG